jgi:integrase
MALNTRIAALTAELAALKAQARSTTQRHRQRDRLTDRKIQTLKTPGFYSDGGNLYLDAWNLPLRNWVLRYSRSGRAHDYGLGAYPAVSLAEARLARDATLAKLRAGIDPVEERRTEKLAPKLERAKLMTFKQCAEAYIAAHEAAWKSAKHVRQWSQTLDAYVYPIFGASPVATVDTALVMKALDPIWRGKTETAARTRGRIEAILDWATARGYRQGENPARWRGHLENLLPRKTKVHRIEHHAALPYGELPQFMTELAAQAGVGALALKLCILTATRTSETLGARWDEVNLADKLWTIPAARMKAGKEHRVPLSEPALDILKRLQKLPPSPFVFAGANPRCPVGQMAMAQALHRMGRDDLTVHGFRSTFRDWIGERTNFASEIAEMALAHKIPNKVEEAYRRGDLLAKRKQLMDAWARFATSPAPEGEVVALADARNSA